MLGSWQEVRRRACSSSPARAGLGEWAAAPARPSAPHLLYAFLEAPTSHLWGRRNCVLIGPEGTSHLPPKNAFPLPFIPLLGQGHQLRLATPTALTGRQLGWDLGVGPPVVTDDFRARSHFYMGYFWSIVAPDHVANASIFTLYNPIL